MKKILAIEISTGKPVWERKAFPQLYQFEPREKFLYSISIVYTMIDAKTGEAMDSFIVRAYFEEKRGFLVIVQSMIYIKLN